MARALSMRKATSGLLVRPREPSDDAFIFDVSRQVFAPYSREPVRSMAAMVAERGAAVCVAENDGARVGFFVLALQPLGRSFGPWEKPAVARLNAIAVAPGLHGRGIGARLLESAIELGRERGAVSLTLMTAETNTPARGLFRSAGFQPFMTEEGAYARRQRAIVMLKAI